MVRYKNAITGYFVGEWDAATSTADTTTLELAQWITTVTDDSNENTEENGFYDGDGTPETDVISVQKIYSFEGFYDASNPAMKLIAEKELLSGEGRKVAFKQIRTDGSVLFGRATVTAIIVTGGEATEFATFSCSIGWDTTPTVTTLPVGP